MNKEILFRKLDDVALCGCCPECGEDCDCQDCMKMNEEEILESMTEEELINFACATFNVNLSRNWAQDHYVGAIMDLYEACA